MFFRRRKPAPPSWEQRLATLTKQGFSLERLPGAEGRVRLSKLGCAAVVEPIGGGECRLVENPGLVIAGETARLVDKGFQKFLVTRSQGAQPALAESLKAIHQFSAELQQVMGGTMLYNQSLGTVSNLYHYDRLEGRNQD